MKMFKDFPPWQNYSWFAYLHKIWKCEYLLVGKRLTIALFPIVEDDVLNTFCLHKIGLAIYIQLWKQNHNNIVSMNVKHVTWITSESQNNEVQASDCY